MAILKTVLWSTACVALGIALTTVHIRGRTPWEHLRGHAPHLEGVKTELKGDLEGAVATAKVKLAPKSGQPVEAHTDTERDAINALVAKRSAKH